MIPWKRIRLLLCLAVMVAMLVFGVLRHPGFGYSERHWVLVGLDEHSISYRLYDPVRSLGVLWLDPPQPRYPLSLDFTVVKTTVTIPDAPQPRRK